MTVPAGRGRPGGVAGLLAGLARGLPGSQPPSSARAGATPGRAGNIGWGSWGSDVITPHSGSRSVLTAPPRPRGTPRCRPGRADTTGAVPASRWRNPESGPVSVLFPANNRRTREGIIMLHLKRRFGKGATIAAASAAVLVAGTGIAVASASGPDITTATTIRLVARGGSSTFVNVRHQPRP